MKSPIKILALIAAFYPVASLAAGNSRISGEAKIIRSHLTNVSLHGQVETTDATIDLKTNNCKQVASPL